MTDETQTLPLADRVSNVSNAFEERMNGLRKQFDVLIAEGLPGPFGPLLPKDLPAHGQRYLDEAVGYAAAMFAILEELSGEMAAAKQRLDTMAGKLGDHKALIADLQKGGTDD